jgi:UDP-N-acetylglucosamine 2-epimerase (non-hydrolysing)
VVADLHFAPTQGARGALLAEGVDPKTIFVTGNTGIDSLFFARRELEDASPALPEAVTKAVAGHRVILMTSHRRENLGERLRGICRAVVDIAARNRDVCVVYPVHLNPAVQAVANEMLGSCERIVLCPPLSYPQFVWMMLRSTILLSDSGGVQEEAPSLGKPVLVLRDTTERPEGVQAGCARLVGTDPGVILSEVETLLNDPAAYGRMAEASNPYGDGTAARQIVNLLCDAAG